MPFHITKQTAAMLALSSLLLVGCDYGRSGRYRLTMQPQRQATATTIPATDERRVIELLQSTLREHGFTELRRDFWTRRGADVQWKVTKPGEVSLSVGAFGAKRELRESEQVELELLRVLLAQPDIRVAPVERTEAIHE